MNIKSYSGTHPFKADCVVTSVELDWVGVFDDEHLANLTNRWSQFVTTALDAGTCPRCSDTFDLKMAAGSRLTSCRCIPICSACGEDEGNQVALGRPYSRVWEWPIGRSARTRRRNQITSRYGKAVPASIVGTSLLTADGVTKFDLTPTTGGWAQYGFDEETTR